MKALKGWQEIAVTVACLALAACGGGDGEAPGSGGESSPRDPVGPGVYGSNWCRNPEIGLLDPIWVPCDSLAGNRPPTAGEEGTSSPSRTIAVLRQPELEPNDDFGLATPLQFPPRGEHDAAGIRVTGSLRDSDDSDDFLLITPLRSATYSIYLCGETCAEVLADDTLFIAVYDQQGVMLAGTEIGAYAEQRIRIDLDAGLPCYVGLHLLQSGGMLRDYDLLILE